MIQRVDGKSPAKPKTAYIHPMSVVIGDVKLGEYSSVWPCAVIRADIAEIIIGDYTNIQDGCLLHTNELKLKIGNRVAVGHGAILHSCDIGDNTLIGMGAIVLDAAQIGENCMIGAGAVIPKGKVIPPGSVVIGNPYRIIREVTEEDIEDMKNRIEEYLALAKTYIRTGNII